jgi:hypothetical protein
MVTQLNVSQAHLSPLTDDHVHAAEHARSQQRPVFSLTFRRRNFLLNFSTPCI